MYEVRFSCRTDSYKTGHFLCTQTPEKMVAYGEFVSPTLIWGMSRIVFYGARYIVETFLNHKYTEEKSSCCRVLQNT